MVNLIRERYSQQVPIILCADSGFADQKAFEHFENKLGIHYIVTNKLYNDIKEYILDLPTEGYSEFRKNKAIWKYIDFGNKLKSWTVSPVYFYKTDDGPKWSVSAGLSPAGFGYTYQYRYV